MRRGEGGVEEGFVPVISEASPLSDTFTTVHRVFVPDYPRVTKGRR